MEVKFINNKSDKLTMGRFAAPVYYLKSLFEMATEPYQFETMCIFKVTRRDVV